MRISLQIKGMSCAACAARIEKGLNQIEGVEAASVNLAAEQASVTFDPETLEISDLANKIEKLGYSVLSQKAELIVEGMT